MNTENTPKDATELVETARRIQAWQASAGKTNAQMIRDFPGLGSDKTYARLREGHTEEYDVDAQLANYRSVWAVIESTSGAAGTEEQLYDDLGAVLQLRRAVLETMRAEGNARVVIIEGPSGIGKTVALRLLAGRYGQRILVVEATDCWGDSPAAMLGAVLRAFDPRGELPTGRVERLEKTLEKLNTSRRCLVIDEAHHLGPHSLNVLKSLVNQTPGEFVLVCIPTLWARLEGSAYMEARQLTTNRLSERVRIDLTEADIGRYLRHAFDGIDAATVAAAAKLIRPAALAAGNFAFVRDTCHAARRMLAGDKAPDIKTFADAVAAAQRRR